MPRHCTLRFVMLRYVSLCYVIDTLWNCFALWYRWRKYFTSATLCAMNSKRASQCIGNHTSNCGTQYLWESCSIKNIRCICNLKSNIGRKDMAQLSAFSCMILGHVIKTITNKLNALSHTHLCFFIGRHGRKGHRNGKVRVIFNIKTTLYDHDRTKPGMRSFVASFACGRWRHRSQENLGPG